MKGSFGPTASPGLASAIGGIIMGLIGVASAGFVVTGGGTIVFPESGLALGQNHPNPTNGMTTIDYLIPSNGKVVLEIVNLLGQNIDTPVNETQTAGIHTVNFNASKLSPGVYYYSLTFNKEKVVKKMVITE